MLCANYVRGELRLFTAFSWRHSGQRDNEGGRKDEEGYVKSIDGSLICWGDLGKYQQTKVGEGTKTCNSSAET